MSLGNEGSSSTGMDAWSEEYHHENGSGNGGSANQNQRQHQPSGLDSPAPQYATRSNSVNYPGPVPPAPQYASRTNSTSNPNGNGGNGYTLSPPPKVYSPFHHGNPNISNDPTSFSPLQGPSGSGANSATNTPLIPYSALPLISKNGLSSTNDHGYAPVPKYDGEGHYGNGKGKETATTIGRHPSLSEQKGTLVREEDWKFEREKGRKVKEKAKMKMDLGDLDLRGQQRPGPGRTPESETDYYLSDGGALHSEHHGGGITSGNETSKGGLTSGQETPGGGMGYDDYDWSTDSDLLEVLEEKFKEMEDRKRLDRSSTEKDTDEKGGKGKKERAKRGLKEVAAKLSPYHIVRLLITTFLGNIIIACLVLAPAIVLTVWWQNQDSQDRSDPDQQHRIFVRRNVEAWCIWFSFNLMMSWVLHFLLELIPIVFLFLVVIIWGNVSEVLKARVDLFKAAKNWIKPLFYAAMAWGSWSVIFGGIFKLRSSTHPDSSEAQYTKRVYQVIQAMFFLVLVVCIEKIFIIFVSLNFHSAAYADRIKESTTALSVLDKLKDYRPKRRHAKRKSNFDRWGGSGSGRNTPRFGFHSRGSTPEGQVSGSDYFTSHGHGQHGGSGDKNNPHAPHAPSHLHTASSNISALESGFGDTTTDLGKPGFWKQRRMRKQAEKAEKEKMQARALAQQGVRPTLGHHQQPSLSPQSERGRGGYDDIPMQSYAPTPNRPAPVASRGGNTPVTFSRNVSGSNLAGMGDNSTVGPQGLTTAPDGGTGLKRPPHARKGSTASIVKFVNKRGITATSIALKAIKDPLSAVGSKSGLGMDITSPAQAKKLARNIFLAFRADPSRNYLVTSDFYPAFHNVAEATEAFKIFDQDGNGDISRGEIKSRVLQVYKERRFLASSLADVGHAVGRLDSVCLVLAGVIFFFILLSVFDIDINKLVTTVYSLGIAAAFIFQGTAQKVFDAIIFLFVTHAFDTGDRIFLDDEVLVVKRMGLLSTLFINWSGEEIFISNAVLGTKFITNLRRSPPQFENATLQVAWDTPFEKLDKLEEKMNSWLSTEEKRMFDPSTSVVLGHFDYQRFMEITVGMLHKDNWQSWGERWARRTAFHAALIHFTQELGITFANSTQPIAYWPQEVASLLESAPAYREEDGGEADIEDEDEPQSPKSIRSNRSLLAREGTMKKDGAAAAPALGYLGFIPPEGTNKTGLKARKAKGGKNKMLQGEGGG